MYIEYTLIRAQEIKSRIRAIQDSGRISEAKESWDMLRLEYDSIMQTPRSEEEIKAEQEKFDRFWDGEEGAGG